MYNQIFKAILRGESRSLVPTIQRKALCTICRQLVRLILVCNPAVQKDRRVQTKRSVYSNRSSLSVFELSPIIIFCFESRIWIRFGWFDFKVVCHFSMDNIIISEPFDSLWTAECSSYNNITLSATRNFFNVFPTNNPDLLTALLLAGKFILFCVSLYAAKTALYFAFWLFFLPFDWTRVSWIESMKLEFCLF